MSFACLQVLFSHKPNHRACVMSTSISTNRTASQDVSEEWLSGLVDAVTQGNVRAVHMLLLLLQASDAGLSMEVSASGRVEYY
jgi:hypothetical protein